MDGRSQVHEVKKVNAAALVSMCAGVVLFTATCWLFYHPPMNMESMLIGSGLFLGIALLGLAGLIPGIIGLVRVKKSGGSQRGGFFGIAGILLCGFVLFYYGMELSTLLIYNVLPEYRLTHPKNEAIAGLAGNWRDPETGLVHVISWQADKGYAVLYVVDSNYLVLPITDESWSNRVLAWTYTSSGTTTTFTMKALQGDKLGISWCSVTGSKSVTGERTLIRIPWDQYAPPAGGF